MSSSAKKRQRSQSAGFPRTRRFSYESPDKLKERELGFVLDGVVLSRLANEDTKRSNPSLNIGIPQYNALRDPANQSYLRRRGLPKTVKEIAEVSTTRGVADTCHTSHNLLRTTAHTHTTHTHTRTHTPHAHTHTHTHTSLSTHKHAHTNRPLGGPTKSSGIGFHDGKGIRSLCKE